MALRGNLIGRVVIGLAALLAATLIILVARPISGDDNLRKLDGTVVAQATLEGVALGPTELHLPGLLSHADLPPNAQVELSWELDIPADTPEGWGVWIERPLYAAELYVDDRLLDRIGDIQGQTRSERSLFAAVPPLNHGTHELRLILQGDYGKGGIVGRMVHGPLPEVWRLATRVEAEKVALVLLLSALAILHLLLASRRQPRLSYAFFGFFCLSLAAYIFLRTDLAALLFPDAPTPLRLRRLITAWIGPLGLGLASTFERNKTPGWVVGLTAAAGTLSIISLILPMDWLPVLEVIFDGLLVVSAGLFFVILIPMALRNVPGAPLLGMSTMVPLTWGAVSEVLVTNGIIGGGSHLLPTVAVTTIGMAASLMQRDAINADRLDRLVHSNVDAILCVDRVGRIVDTNKSADQLFGPRGKGGNLLEWVVSDDQVLIRAHLAASENRPERAEFRLRGTDRILESVATELDDQSLMLTLRDVTKRRRQDKGLLQAARMETLAVLVGGLAHDFNNKLGTLLAHVGFLQATSGDQPKLRTRLQRMEVTIERASQLTRGLLALTRGTSAILEPTSLSGVVGAAVDLIRPSWPERADLMVDVSEGLPKIAGSRSDLEQVIVNLLVNARDAVGLAGSVRIIGRPFTTSGGARGVLLAIEDSGPGVPVELRDEVFTPFFSTKERQDGAGLGLAVAAQITREHHGRLWVEDRPGGGARFCLALHEADQLASMPEVDPSGQRLVLVEDEGALRETWATALRKRGYEVMDFGDGAKAADYLAENQPDALLTDVLLPGLNGLQLASLCRAIHPEVPVVLISGYIPEDTLEHDPSIYRLDKPIRTSRLLATVARVLGAGANGDASPNGYPFLSLEEVTYESAHWGTPSEPPRPRRA